MFAAKLRLRKDRLTPKAETTLCIRGGFFVMERGVDYVILAKRKDWVPPAFLDKKPTTKDLYDAQKAAIDIMSSTPRTEEISVEGIPEFRIKELNRLCKRTVDAFAEPEKHKHHIRQQLHNMGQRLTNLEQEYVENWCFQYVL